MLDVVNGGNSVIKLLTASYGKNLVHVTTFSGLRPLLFNQRLVMSELLRHLEEKVSLLKLQMN